MGRRRIDWEVIERDFRAGILTFREISTKHNISTSTLNVNAKKFGWVRDLTEAINKRTQQKISEIDIRHIIEQNATESAQKTIQTAQDAIELAANIKTDIVIKHRSIVKEGLENAAKIEDKFNLIMEQAAEIRDIVTVTTAFKNLIDAKSKLIEMERKSFKLDAEAEEASKKVNVRVSFVE